MAFQGPSQQPPLLPPQLEPYTKDSPLDLATANLQAVASAPPHSNAPYNFLLEGTYSTSHLLLHTINQISTFASFSSTVGKDGATPEQLFSELYNLLGAFRQARQLLHLRDGELESALLDVATSADDINKLTIERDTLLQVVGGRGTTTQRSPEHPDPAPFEGDPNQLTDWLQDMNLKMQQNKDWWDTEQKKMIYFVSRLGKDPKNVMRFALDTPGVIALDNVNSVIEILRSSYGDINEKGTAQTRIFVEKQGKRSLTTFLPVWQGLASRTEFNDAAKIAVLKGNIHPDLLARSNFTPTTSIPSDLPGFIMHLRRTDATLRESDPTYYLKSPRGSGAPALPHFSPAAVPTHTPDAGDPMDLSVAGVRVIWTGSNGGKKRPQNDAERAAKKLFCIQNNLCLYCESPKHRIPECPLAPTRNNFGKKKEAVNQVDVASDSEN